MSDIIGHCASADRTATRSAAANCPQGVPPTMHTISISLPGSDLLEGREERPGVDEGQGIGCEQRLREP